MMTLCHLEKANVNIALPLSLNILAVSYALMSLIHGMAA